jgi:hypothetical protein
LLQKNEKANYLADLYRVLSFVDAIHHRRDGKTTEKRRESGASVALAADIGNLESVRLGGGGVYQDWANQGANGNDVALLTCSTATHPTDELAF